MHKFFIDHMIDNYIHYMIDHMDHVIIIKTVY